MDNSKRLLSLDTLRGFDFLFIMGFATLVVKICALIPGGTDCWLAQQMEHVEWAGLRHHDTIFPLFLFIAGISFPFSYAKRLANGASKAAVYKKIFTRGAVLVLLGLVCNGLFNLDFHNLRLCSVLARIGLGWMFAALLFVNFKPKARAIIAAAILVGYWLLLRFVPAPDQPGADPLSLEGNLVGYVDRMLLGASHLYTNGMFDPEGLLSTIPAIVTAMLGMFTGEFVRKGEDTKLFGKPLTENRKVIAMFAAAAVMLVVGLLWSLDFPIIKKLWTSTFVLVVGAYSLASFALFYWIIDVKGWTKWTFFFKVIGMNSITIFMAPRIIGLRQASKFFLGGLANVLPEQWGAVVLAAGYVAVCWLFLYFLYRQKIFIKV